MSLGSLLLRDGRVNSHEFELAVSHQTRFGGKIGTALVELHLLDASTLTIYLGTVVGVPVATRAQLERAKRSAVRLLTPEQAERFQSIPLIIQDRQLVVAMLDPHDFVVLDELANLTGYRIIPRIAPEVRLYYYLEHYYGIRRPPRFLALGESVVGDQRAQADDLEPPPPPLPGLPPVGRVPPPPPTALPRPDRPMAIPNGDSEDVPISQAAPSPEGKQGGDVPLRGRRLTAGQAIELMQQASRRGQIADAIIGYSKSILDVGVLFMVRGDLALGWRGFGPGLSADRVESLLIPIQAQSIFRATVQEGQVFHGAVPPSIPHLYLFKVLRQTAPHAAIVVPVRIRDRVVNLIYGHTREADISEPRLLELQQVANAAAQAYMRLITLLKTQGGSQSMARDP